MQITEHALYSQFPTTFDATTANPISDKNGNLKGYIDGTGNSIVFNKTQTNFQFYTNEERLALWESLKIKVSPKVFLPFYKNDSGKSSPSTDDSRSTASIEDITFTEVEPIVQKKKEKKSYDRLTQMEFTIKNAKKFFKKDLTLDSLNKIFTKNQNSKWDTVIEVVKKFTTGKSEFNQEELLDFAQLVVAIAYTPKKKK